MEAKYYPIAAVLVVLSGMAGQCMNVSAVLGEMEVSCR